MQPTPEPEPTATIVPVPIDTGPAQSRGYSDGQDDGAREASVRAPAEGDHEGREVGYREGFARCEQEERERAYDAGYKEGYVRGEGEGAQEGHRAGQVNGSAKGSENGRVDGINRADHDANAEASPLGRAKGIDEANHSDAAARGKADGLAAGDRDALEKARTDDYQRGRRDFRNESYAGEVEANDEFSQIGAPGAGQKIAQAKAPQSFFSRLMNAFRTKAAAFRNGIAEEAAFGEFSLSSVGRPDKRFFRPRANYGTQEENDAYLNAYESGYDEGFHSTYTSLYRNAYDRAYHTSNRDGCRRAQAGNYRRDFERGNDEGRRRGYELAYQPAYDQAYQYAYNQSFQAASAEAYRSMYPSAYNRHFEKARASAYSERFDDLYDAAFGQAHDAKFAEVYPGYAAREYKRGRADETQDFNLRPVRLMEAAVLETIPNGLHEPGEALRMRIKLRNFAVAKIASKDVKVKIEALAEGAAVLTQAEASLARDLRAKSVTTVSDILEFRMTEEVANEAHLIRLTAYFQGRVIGQETLRIEVRYIASMTFAESPALHEGMEGVIRIKVKNQSEAATDSSFSVRFSSKSSAIEITRGEALVGVLAPGESKVVEFGVIARAGGAPRIPFVLEATAAGRRIGLVDQTREIPVINDYTIELEGSAASLSKGGVARLYYKVKNVNSRVVLKSLQLKARILAKDSRESDAFVVIGPNPQYLNPLLQGQSTKFVIPILAKHENNGGIVELEVQESGRTVVVHRVEF